MATSAFAAVRSSVSWLKPEFFSIELVLPFAELPVFDLPILRNQGPDALESLISGKNNDTREGARIDSRCRQHLVEMRVTQQGSKHLSRRPWTQNCYYRFIGWSLRVEHSTDLTARPP